MAETNGASVFAALAEPSAESPAGLSNGSRIAVVGGGPSGSMFSFFVRRMAGTVGREFQVDIYEPRRFTHGGPAGCNHCGGIVSESLVQRLATEGLNLPTNVIQRGIDSYTLHMDVGAVRIEKPLHEKRIAAVFRGSGPRGQQHARIVGLDAYLQELAASSGAKVVRQLVTDVQRTDQGMQVTCADGRTEHYDLVVVATGINSRFLDILSTRHKVFRPPAATRTFICELPVEGDSIKQHLGTSMHIFLLNIPRLEFAALIPKGNYATLCLLGDDIDEALVRRFLGAQEVRRCFSGAAIPAHVCHCSPLMNTASARESFGDGLVVIGDCGTTRLLKDGLGAAYRTAKAAARTVAFHGISAEDFRRHYWPTCRDLNFDNGVGRALFAFSGLIQKLRFAQRAVLRMTAMEQARAKGAKRMSGILWDLFTGSAPYRDVFRRTLHPAYFGGLIWNLLATSWAEVKCAVGEQARGG